MPYSLTKNNKSKTVITLIKIAGATVLAIIFLEIWVVNRLSTYGDKIVEIKTAKAALEQENKILENEIAQNSSLLHIDQLAPQFGFKSVGNIEYIK